VDGGSGGPAGAGGNDKVTVEQLVRGAWRSLCSIRPPKSLWRTVGALVLGGQALVRILQGELVRSGGRGWPLPPPLLSMAVNARGSLPSTPPCSLALWSALLLPFHRLSQSLPPLACCHPCQPLPHRRHLTCPNFFSILRPRPLLLSSLLTAGKIHWKNTTEQLDMVGPRSLGVCLLTAAFVGMVFTIQFIRQVEAPLSWAGVQQVSAGTAEAAGGAQPGS
jgi:hypothetical protein